MIDPNFFILYVDSPVASAAFYSELLNKAPLDVSETFALFALDSGAKFGLWSKHTVLPAVAAFGIGGELGFAVADKNAVDVIYRRWVELGLSVIQTPVTMDFGYTFVALDADGHRLRVFAAGNA